MAVDVLDLYVARTSAAFVLRCMIHKPLSSTRNYFSHLYNLSGDLKNIISIGFLRQNIDLAKISLDMLPIDSPDDESAMIELIALFT